MKKFTSQNKNADLTEGKVWDWVQKKFSQLKGFIFNLKFGETKIERLSFEVKDIREGFLTEAGDWHATVCGVYAEGWAVWSLANEMKNNKLQLETSVDESRKEAEKYWKSSGK